MEEFNHDGFDKSKSTTRKKYRGVHEIASTTGIPNCLVVEEKCIKAKIAMRKFVRKVCTSTCPLQYNVPSTGAADQFLHTKIGLTVN